MARMIQCVRLKKEAEGLDYPPYPGPIGIKLYEQVSKVARARKYLEEQMMRHFFGDGAEQASGYVPPAA
jgi:Fe-S cluster biosynthesis and repair protein YggX